MKNRIFVLWLSVVLCFNLISTASAAVRPGDDVGGGDQITTLKPSTDTSGDTDTPGTDTPGTNTPGTNTPPNTHPNTSSDYDYTPSSPSYSVGNSSGTADHGSWSANKSSAKKGDTVTITVTPDDGYQVDKVTVKDAQGRDVAVTANMNGKYTFTMPGSTVSVDVTFTPDWTNPFPDVAETDWFYSAVRFANANGFMNGMDNGTFAPNEHFSRAMFVQVLYNHENRPSITASNLFSDVPSGQWYTDAVNWGKRMGVVGGYGDGTFRPHKDITRQEFAVMLYNYAGKPTVPAITLSFPDAAQISTWAQEALCWAVQEGVVNGRTDGTLDPTGLATRAEAAQMIMNYFGKK